MTIAGTSIERFTQPTAGIHKPGLVGFATLNELHRHRHRRNVRLAVVEREEYRASRIGLPKESSGELELAELAS